MPGGSASTLRSGSKHDAQAGSPVAELLQGVLHELLPCRQPRVAERVYNRPEILDRTSASENQKPAVQECGEAVRDRPCSEKGLMSICCGPKVHHRRRVLPSASWTSIIGFSGFLVRMASRSSFVGRPGGRASHVGFTIPFTPQASLQPRSPHMLHERSKRCCCAAILWSRAAATAHTHTCAHQSSCTARLADKRTTHPPARACPSPRTSQHTLRHRPSR